MSIFWAAKREGDTYFGADVPDILSDGFPRRLVGAFRCRKEADSAGVHVGEVRLAFDWTLPGDGDGRAVLAVTASEIPGSKGDAFVGSSCLSPVLYVQPLPFV